MTSATPPRVLTVAGSDSGGGAGIQADLKTMLALGVHGMSAITAVTAQNSMGVHGSWDLPADAVRAQLDAILSDIGVDAIKTGMLSSPSIVRTVCDVLDEVEVPIVVDPVAMSKHGDPLLEPAAVDLVRTALIPLATVVTPNVGEVELFTGVRICGEADLLAAAEAVKALGARWALIKGGHLPDTAADLLYDGQREYRFTAERLPNRHTHGTGCTLASAIASYLALGSDVVEAVAKAKDYVTGAITRGFPLGSGIGPVDHAWNLGGTA